MEKLTKISNGQRPCLSINPNFYVNNMDGTLLNLSWILLNTIRGKVFHGRILKKINHIQIYSMQPLVLNHQIIIPTTFVNLVTKLPFFLYLLSLTWKPRY